MQQNRIREKINFAKSQITKGKDLYFRTDNDKIKRSIAKLIMNNHRELIELQKTLR